MASSSSYAPNETHSTIVQEETWLQGALLSNFFFGIQTTLSVMASIAVHRRQTPDYRLMRTILLVYIAVLFVIATAVQGLLLDWIQMGFITQRNYPGGPSAFFNDEWSIPESVAENFLGVVANWMMEALLVWRCRVVCNTTERLWWLGIAVPFGFLIAVIVTGTLFIYQSIRASLPTAFVLAYSISSLALNLTATAVIAGRLLVYRYRIVSLLGRGHGRSYVGVLAIVVESAAIYTAFVLVVIVAYATGSPAANILQQVILQVQVITSLLIIWRIARGEGWTESTVTEMMSTMVLSSSTRIGPQFELAQPNEVEGNIRRKKDGSKVSLSKCEEARAL